MIDESTATLAAAVIEELGQRGQTLSTCESLTAGLLSATVASVSGASAVLQGGLITYSAELKHALAGVEWEILESVGVVSEDCAVAMAQGAKAECRSSWAVSLTGVAGPTLKDGHPVGEVWIAVAGPEDFVHAQLVEDGEVPLAECNRNAIRAHCVTSALELLLRLVREQDC